MSEPRATLLAFPCEFPVKIFGLNSEGWEQRMLDIVRRHAPELAADAAASRTSGGGKYLALTVTLQAQSQAQLDAIYVDLSASPEVVMAL